MPNFFDKKNLTQEQKDRWDDAVIRYKQIQSNNFESYLSSLSKEEKLFLMKEQDCSNELELYEKSKQLSNLFYLVGDESSALFARLLNGQKPLLFPPPCAYSYPWYSVIENEGPWEVNTFADDEQDIKQFKSDIKNPMDENDYLIISQQNWKVLQYINKTEAILTYGNWEKLGFKWKLSLETVLAKESQASLICHHDPKIGKITTLEQLEKEAQFQIGQKYEAVHLVLDEEKYKEKLKSSIEKYGKGFGEKIVQQELQKGKDVIKERKNKGLPVFPTPQEIKDKLKQRVDTMLKLGYSVDSQGNLLSSVWRLHKIAMPTNPNIYA